MVGALQEGWEATDSPSGLRGCRGAVHSRLVDHPSLLKFVQEHFSDGLVLVVGSGLSAAEGVPGMPALADHLIGASAALAGTDKELWERIAAALAAKEGLEAALLKHQPTESLEAWIRRETCNCLKPKEREIVSAVIAGKKTLRLTELLKRVLKSPTGLPILTPNYDRLIEVACEMAGLHVDTTACGIYAGTFDHRRSMMASCRAIRQAGKVHVLDHQPRAVVLKPHGSFDWYRNGTGAFRCSMELDSEVSIITPGLNKYRAGYNAPFDKHRDLANDFIKQAARLLVVGYGFNDDHLQTHLVQRITDGTPTLVLTRTTNAKMDKLALESPQCVSISKPSEFPGIKVITKSTQFEQQGADLWDLGILAREVLE